MGQRLFFPWFALLCFDLCGMVVIMWATILPAVRFLRREPPPTGLRSSCFWFEQTRRRKLVGAGVRCYHHTDSSSLGFAEPTTILFLAGLYPEPNASAAGVRTKFLVEQLAKTKGVQAIHFGTGASKPKIKDTNTTFSTLTYLQKELGVQFHHVPVNNSDVIDELLKKCGVKTNDGKNLVVIIDRFYNEEAYSFHIHKHCPKAAIVLDMQDLHSLRRHRQLLVQQQQQQQQQQQCRDRSNNHNNMFDPLSNLPVTDFPMATNVDLQRELASIHRSDLTLVCSPLEMDILHNIYGIPRNKLCLATFFVDNIPNTTTTTTPFEQRKDFVFIGGFRHDPNVDAVWQMKQLWPRIREELGRRDDNDDNNNNNNNNNQKKVKFHVYGPFCPHNLREACHNPAARDGGFIIHGWTDKSVQEILEDKRVLLAPLRFGAGIKGKIVDAWTYGTPVVTTPIGSEGMSLLSSSSQSSSLLPSWGGVIAHDSQSFVDGAVHLYRNHQNQWQQAQQSGKEILSNLYGMHHWDSVLEQLIKVCQSLETRRESDFTRGLLWQQSTRSTEYFSRWLELKQKKAQ